MNTYTLPAGFLNRIRMINDFDHLCYTDSKTCMASFRIRPTSQTEYKSRDHCNKCGCMERGLVYVGKREYNTSILSEIDSDVDISKWTPLEINDYLEDNHFDEYYVSVVHELLCFECYSQIESSDDLISSEIR